MQNLGDWKIYVIPVLYVITSFVSIKITTSAQKKAMKKKEIVIDENDILEYLKVNKKFINYLNENDLRVIYVNYNIEKEKEHIGVNLKFDGNDNLQDIKIFVPTIINLETALIYCHEMAKAFGFYKFIGKCISLDDEKGILEYADLQAESFEISYHEREKKLLPYK